VIDFPSKLIGLLKEWLFCRMLLLCYITLVHLEYCTTISQTIDRLRGPFLYFSHAKKIPNKVPIGSNLE
jgi:hypothetical protein